MHIRKAVVEDIESLVTVIKDSDLGNVYFKNDEDKIKRMIQSEIEHDNIVVGLNRASECIAVLTYKLDGAFGFHPYIHIIAVARESRGNGFGTQLLKYFEDEIVPNYKKIFLLVGKWNFRAEKLYEKIGFEKRCELEDFYSEGITESLMIKERK